MVKETNILDFENLNHKRNPLFSETTKNLSELKRKKLIIIGASGHGKVVADIAEKNGYSTIDFLDDDITKKMNSRYLVIGTTKDVKKIIDEADENNTYDFFVAIGDNAIRKRISDELTCLNVKQPILIHPSAIIDNTVVIDEGTVIMANVVINADTKIGKGCIINTSSSIDHDCVIDDFVHISPGSHLAGTVYVGEKTWIGIGCTIINNVNIGSNITIGAGSTIIRNIKDIGTYVGTPAKKR